MVQKGPGVRRRDRVPLLRAVARRGGRGARRLGSRAGNGSFPRPVLDQFPRNMFRSSADAFATDPLARNVAERAVARGFDQKVPASERLFFYLPFEHSESPADQE